MKEGIKVLTIWKYELSHSGCHLEMPKDAVLLSVQVQDETPRLWVLVDEDADLEQREVTVIGTGHMSEALDELKFIDTFQMAGGLLVYHAFEVLNA